MDPFVTGGRTGPARVSRVNGPLVEADGLGDVAMSELVRLGPGGLLGEVVGVDGSVTSVQAYEYTGGLAVGDPVTALGRPLSARLGPGLLGGVFDGLLRPLASAPTWLSPGSQPEQAGGQWRWVPSVSEGSQVGAGTVLGVVPEAGGVEHRVLVPPGVHGRVSGLRSAGTYDADDAVAAVGDIPVRLSSRWPMRRPRPVRERVPAAEPLLTGQRVIDAIFPLARGSSAVVPGGFGTGKTMLLQQIAKWCDADVIVYVGCGERGNEMADVLRELAALTDARGSGRLIDRTVIIANTSNMPMMARESSIYTGVTVAEYFRDMGYHAVVIADSTSRWAEALREFASRTGALPAEEGYPASLPSALAAFYERASRVVTLGGLAASVTIIGSVSPAGGDTTEPVTAQTERFVRARWSLDRDLAYARHYPAVGWADSFARDTTSLGTWYARHGDPDWGTRRARVTALLGDADRLGELAELVGAGSLPAHQRVVLLAGRLLREGVLQQNSLSDNDSHSSAAKTAALIDTVLAVIDQARALVADGVAASRLESVDYSPVLRAGQDTPPDDVAGVVARRHTMLRALGGLR